MWLVGLQLLSPGLQLLCQTASLSREGLRSHTRPLTARQAAPARRLLGRRAPDVPRGAPPPQPPPQPTHACRTGPSAPLLFASRLLPWPPSLRGPVWDVWRCERAARRCRSALPDHFGDSRRLSATLRPPQARKGLLSGPHFPRRRVSLPLNAHFGIARRAELHRPRGRRGVCDLSDPSSP